MNNIKALLIKIVAFFLMFLVINLNHKVEAKNQEKTDLKLSINTNSTANSFSLSKSKNLSETFRNFPFLYDFERNDIPDGIEEKTGKEIILLANAISNKYSNSPLTYVRTHNKIVYVVIPKLRKFYVFPNEVDGDTFEIVRTLDFEGNQMNTFWGAKGTYTLQSRAFMAKDKNRVYEVKVEGFNLVRTTLEIDVHSFEFIGKSNIDGLYFYKDKSSIYATYLNKLWTLYAADIDTFTIDTSHSFWEDKNRIYLYSPLRNDILMSKSINSSTFEKIEDTPFYKDKDNIYFLSSIYQLAQVKGVTSEAAKIRKTNGGYTVTEGDVIWFLDSSSNLTRLK